MPRQIIGRRFSLLVSEPWDFGTCHGVGPFLGVIEDQTGEDVLLRLDHPMEYQEVVFEKLVAYARYAGEHPAKVMDGGNVTVEIVPIRLSGLNPSVISSLVKEDDKWWIKAVKTWRGWGLTGTLTLE